MSDGVTRVRKKACPECGHTLDAVGAMSEGERGPQPGDPIACILCGAVMTVDGEGGLRGFTEPEMDELIADGEAMTELAKMVRSIHLLKHATN